jgi:hypothetical protein
LSRFIEHPVKSPWTQGPSHDEQPIVSQSIRLLAQSEHNY